MEPRRPRVVLAIESSGPGGAEQMLLRLGSGLACAGFDPIVATLRPGWLTERAEVAGFPVWIVPQRRGLDPAWPFRFAARLRRHRVDVVHAHEFAMGVYAGAAARLAFRRAVVTLHGHHWIAERARRGTALRWIRRIGVPVVAVSDELARFAEDAMGVPPSTLRVVPNGVPVARRRADSETAAMGESLRRELGIGAERPLVLAVGSLYPVKDHATLVRAAAALPGVTVAIAGRGKEESRLRALIDELGVADRVLLLGLRDDVDRLLAAADVVAHCSLSEGMPLAILEAMAAGRAVVATAVGGIPELVTHGVCGLLVPPGEPAQLAAAISRLLGDPSRRCALGAAARARVESRFSIEAMVARYEHLYRRTP